MPIPPHVLAKILHVVATSARGAFRGTTLIKKIERIPIGEYVVYIKRRASLGRDGGIAQMVRVFKSGKFEEAWHMVVRAGRIIHRHLK